MGKRPGVDFILNRHFAGLTNYRDVLLVWIRNHSKYSHLDPTPFPRYFLFSRHTFLLRRSLSRSAIPTVLQLMHAEQSEQIVLVSESSESSRTPDIADSSDVRVVPRLPKPGVWTARYRLPEFPIWRVCYSSYIQSTNIEYSIKKILWL